MLDGILATRNLTLGPGTPGPAVFSWLGLLGSSVRTMARGNAITVAGESISRGHEHPVGLRTVGTRWVHDARLLLMGGQSTANPWEMLLALRCRLPNAALTRSSW